MVTGKSGFFVCRLTQLANSVSPSRTATWAFEDDAAWVALASHHTAQLLSDPFLFLLYKIVGGQRTSQSKHSSRRAGETSAALPADLKNLAP